MDLVIEVKYLGLRPAQMEKHSTDEACFAKL